MEKVLLYFALKYKGNWDQIFKALDEKELIAFEQLKSIKNQIKCLYVTILDKNYPKALKNINKPPFVLFYQGDLNYLNVENDIFAFSNPNQDFDQYLEQIFNDLIPKIINKGKIIITNFENKSELLLHQLANKYHKPSIIISASGLNSKLSNKNIKINDNNLILSEYPFILDNNKNLIISSQRIIAGLATTLLVLPTANIGDSRKLINFFIAANKNILVIPNQIYNNNSSNQLIKEGAKLVETIDDVINNM